MKRDGLKRRSGARRDRARIWFLALVGGAMTLACATAHPTQPAPSSTTQSRRLQLELRPRPVGAAPLVVVFPGPANHAAPRPAATVTTSPDRRPRYQADLRPRTDDLLPPEAVAESCLTTLDRLGVAYRLGPRLLGIRISVEILGPIGGIDLAPHGARPPVMDCELARTLAKVAPLFRDLGIVGLTSSGAYNYRTRRRSAQLSTHAFGLAIDVHGFETHLGHLDIERDYPRDPHRWRGLERRQKPSVACVGTPGTRAGRLLRTLACELRMHPSIRLVLSPDDDADHHNHLHIEAYPGADPPVASR